jgi:hypothetical protein
MKLPKLKYYCMAMPESDYQAFADTRRIEPRGRTELNPVTGAVTTLAAHVYLYATPHIADTRYRQQNHWDLPLWVLRIPAACIDRAQLESAPDPAGMWILSDAISVPHCGVERFELAPRAAPRIIARSCRA